MPIKIRITPPAISALDFHRVPNTLPIFTPVQEMAKVVRPMMQTPRSVLRSSLAAMS